MPKSYESKLRQAEEKRRPRDDEPAYEPIEGVTQQIMIGYSHPETADFELMTTYVDDTLTIDELHDHIMGEVMKIQHEHKRSPLKCDYSKKQLYFDRLYMRPRACGREFTLQDYGFRPGYRVTLNPLWGFEAIWGAPRPSRPEKQNFVEGPVPDSKMMRRIDKSPGTPARQLFCFPFLGGTAETFATIAAKAPKDLAIFAMQNPGRSDRELDEQYPSGEYLAKVYAMTVAPQMKKKPNNNFFYAHSQGTHFAYYALKILKKDFDIVPKAFFVSNFATPLGRTMRDVSTMRLRQQQVCSLKVFVNLVKQGWGLEPRLAYKDHTGLCNYQLESFWPAAKMVMSDWFMTFDFPLPNADEPAPCPIKAVHGVGDKAVSTAMVKEWKGLSSDPNMFELVETEGEHLWWMNNTEKSEWLMKTLEGFMQQFK